MRECAVEQLINLVPFHCVFESGASVFEPDSVMPYVLQISFIIHILLRVQTINLVLTKYFRRGPNLNDHTGFFRAYTSITSESSMIGIMSAVLPFGQNGVWAKKITLFLSIWFNINNLFFLTFTIRIILWPSLNASFFLNQFQPI